MGISTLTRVFIFVCILSDAVAEDHRKLQPSRFNVTKEEILQDLRTIPIDHQVSAFLYKDDTQMFFFLHEENLSPLSVTVTPCTSSIAWKVRLLQQNDTVFDTSVIINQPHLCEFHGKELHSWSVEDAQKGIYILQITALERETYVYLYVSLQRGGPHPFKLTQKSRLRILQRNRRKRLTVRWEPSSIDPHVTHYCLVVNTRKYYHSLCEAEGERDGVLPPEKISELEFRLSRQDESTAQTSSTERVSDSEIGPIFEDILVGCVGRRTSYTVSHLEQGKAYHFNLFAVNRRTNLSIPYGKATLKYEPRNKPFRLKDGKASAVNLRKFDGRATFHFKVGRKSGDSLIMYIMACGGGEVEVEILLRNKSVIPRHQILGYERLSIPGVIRGQRYIIRVLVLSPEELQRIVSIEVMATAHFVKRFPFPELPSNGALVHEYDSMRRCDSVTIGWLPSPDPDAARYCVYLYENSLLSERSPRYPDQCGLDLYLSTKSQSARTHCQQIYPDDHRSVITQTIYNLTHGRNYIVQVTVSKVNGKTLSYNLLQVLTKPVCV